MGGVHRWIAARSWTLQGNLYLVLEGAFCVVGPIHCWLLLRLLLVMVGHAGKSWGANGKEDILLVLGLRLGLWLWWLYLMLRGAVRRTICGRAVGGLLMLIHRWPWGGPGRWLGALGRWGSNVQGGVSAVRIVPRRDLQSLWNTGYTLRKCDRYRVHSITWDGGVCGRHALHCGWRGGSTSWPALIVHKERIVTRGGGHGGRGRQWLRVAGPLGFDMTVTGAVHEGAPDSRCASICLVCIWARVAQANV